MPHFSKEGEPFAFLLKTIIKGGRGITLIYQFILYILKRSIPVFFLCIKSYLNLITIFIRKKVVPIFLGNTYEIFFFLTLAEQLHTGFQTEVLIIKSVLWLPYHSQNVNIPCEAFDNSPLADLSPRHEHTVEEASAGPNAGVGAEHGAPD